MQSWLRNGQRQAALVFVLLFVVACGAPQRAPLATPAPAAATPTSPPVTAASPSAAGSPAPAPLPTLTPPPTPRLGGLFVDAGQRLGPISRLSYGSNIGPWTTIPLETQDEVKAAGLTFMRFPGGNWGDEYDLTPQQIDQYLAQCQAYGFEPSISVRLFQSTPEQAAELVRAVNVTRRAGVRYWSIGNEPSLYATSRKTPYDTERYNQEWRAFATAMRAVDPEIVLLGPEIHQYDAAGGPRDAAGRFWMEEFLKANGDLVDIVAIHRYPFPKTASDPSPTIADLRANSREWDTIIPALRNQIRTITGRDLPVAVTEINANWTGAARGEATPDSPYAAIWWSDVLGRLIRQRVAIVAQFAIHGPGRQGWGLVESFKVRPAYHVYRLYGLFGNELLASSSDDPEVSIFTAQRPDGALTLMIVNLGAQPKRMPLTLDGFDPVASAETWRLDEQTLAEQIAPTALGAGATLELPPASATLLIVPPR